MQIHPRKMKVYQIERNKKYNWMKAKKKKPVKLKTGNGGLGKN